MEYFCQRPLSVWLPADKQLIRNSLLIFYAYFYLQTNILIFALGFGNQFLISEHFYFSINLSGGGEPHNVIEDGHRESTASLANRSGIMAEKNISLRLWALPMKPSSSWAIRTANWQGSTAASTILRWGISETGRRWRKLRSGSIWNFSSTLLIRNMNGEWPVGATEPSACLSWWKTSLKQSWNKKWWKDEGAFFHQLFRRIESVAIFAPALARLGGLKKTLKEG